MSASVAEVVTVVAGVSSTEAQPSIPAAPSRRRKAW
jgi:hypothetical protein